MGIKGERFEVTGELGPVAYYDLAKHPTTYDFVTWAVIVSTLGAKQVRFVYDGHIVDTKYAEAIAWRRFVNILAPTCQLAGMRYTMNPKPEGFTTTYAFGHVEKLYRERGSIQKLTPSFATVAPEPYTTITIRKSIRNPWRDSNRPAWDRVADELRKSGQVLVLEDSETDPIELHGRMALYRGARMNLFVNGGPASLCLFSDAPYRVFNMLPACDEGKALREHMDRTGFPDGSQFSFRAPNQRIVWMPDTFENIMGAL